MTTKSPSQELGDLVAKYRKTQGRSAREVARDAGIDIATMTRLEQGHYSSPSPHTLRGLSKALGIPLLELFRVAGYVTPYDLVDMAKYANRNGELAYEAVVSQEEYLQRLIDEGFDYERDVKDA